MTFPSMLTTVTAIPTRPQAKGKKQRSGQAFQVQCPHGSPMHLVKMHTLIPYV